MVRIFAYSHIRRFADSQIRRFADSQIRIFACFSGFMHGWEYSGIAMAGDRGDSVP